MVGIFIISALMFVFVFSILTTLQKNERRKEENLEFLLLDSGEQQSKNTKINKQSYCYKIFKSKYQQKLLQANFPITYSEFATIFNIICIGTPIATIICFILMGPIIALAVLVLIFASLKMVPTIIIGHQKSKMMSQINAQKNDILSIMSSCSKVNSPLDMTFLTLSKRLNSPCDKIFGDAYSMLVLGNDPNEVLTHLSNLFDSNDFNFLLTSYQIWLDNQGSLEDTYKLVAKSIQDKEEIDLNMQGLHNTAKMNFFIIIGVSLFFVLLSLFALSDIFIPFVQSTLGQILILISIVILISGVMIVNKIEHSVKY